MDNGLDTLILNADEVCYADFCRLLQVIWWNM